MTDLAQLEADLLSAVAAASDEAALEAVRVSALGKKGSISALLATLGQMAPDERKAAGWAVAGAAAATAGELAHDFETGEIRQPGEED